MSQTDSNDTSPQADENHIIAERRAKLAEWRQTGKAYPNDFARENTAGKINENYDRKDARNSPRRRSKSASPAASCSSG
jgi:lysyl-tRNA synthetase class 2